MLYVVKWIPAAMRVQFAHNIIALVRLRIVRFRRESVAYPGRISITFGFPDLLGSSTFV